jgi:NADPH:quinone reductase-like Zn-dependent oxidoreductase
LSVISNQGALEPTKMCFVGRMLGASTSDPIASVQIGAVPCLAALRSSQRAVFFLTKLNQADLVVVRELLEAGNVTPAIDRRYELSEIADALQSLGEGHAQAKIVITV